MTRISQWAVKHPIWGLVSWFAIIGVLLVMLTQFKGDFNDDFGLPASESTTAQDLLKDISGGGAGTGSGLDGQIVWRVDSGKATEGPAAQEVAAALKEISALPSVSCVISPLAAPMGPDCLPQQAPSAPTPEQEAAMAKLPPEALGPLAHFGQAGVSPNGNIAYATVQFQGADIGDLPTERIEKALNVVKGLNGTDGLTVGANNVFTFVQGEPPSSEGIGILVALTILMFAFASILGAFLPVWVAAISVGVSTAVVVPIIANFFSVAAFAPFLSSMIGLGVGIDYSLFIINRYRDALLHGREPREAALESVRTSGRAVLFAAVTVIIALLGLFIMGISFFNGVALAAAGTVVMVALGALLLLPSLLALLGTWAFVGRMAWITNDEALPRQKADGLLHGVAVVLRVIGWIVLLPVTVIGWLWRRLVHGGKAPDVHTPSWFARYGEWLQKHPWPLAIGALVVMILIAIPVTQLRQGFPDDSGAAKGSVARVAYDLTAEGFGPGVNGPMFIAVDLPDEGGQAAMTSLTQALSADPGVALAAAAPTAPGATVGVVQVYPKTAPQDVASTDLLFHLRETVIPQALDGTGASAYVGGFQAVTADFTKVLTAALPLFLLIVVGLGFIALLFLFRSILVPLMGVLFSLLSLGASLGITVAVFQWGWLSGPLGLQNTGPIFPFLPIMVFAILFGLSCDYQVFLVSRMHEEWDRGKDHHRAIRRGLAGSGRVVAIAALIMTSVFAAFALGNDPTTKLFAVSLSSAVLLDAFVVRLVLVPALMAVIGPNTWWLPGWLDKILPHFSVEAEYTCDDEIADIEDAPVPA